MALDFKIRDSVDKGWSYLTLKPEALGYEDDVIEEFKLRDIEKVFAFRKNEEDEELFDFAWVQAVVEKEGAAPQLYFFPLTEIEDYVGFDFSRFEDHLNPDKPFEETSILEKCTENQVNLLATISLESMSVEAHTRKMEQYIDYVTPPPPGGKATVTNINNFRSSSNNDVPTPD